MHFAIAGPSHIQVTVLLSVDQSRRGETTGPALIMNLIEAGPHIAGGLGWSEAPRGPHPGALS